MAYYITLNDNGGGLLALSQYPFPIDGEKWGKWLPALEGVSGVFDRRYFVLSIIQLVYWLDGGHHICPVQLGVKCKIVDRNYNQTMALGPLRIGHPLAAWTVATMSKFAWECAKRAREYADIVHTTEAASAAFSAVATANFIYASLLNENPDMDYIVRAVATVAGAADMAARDIDGAIPERLIQARRLAELLGIPYDAPGGAE